MPSVRLTEESARKLKPEAGRQVAYFDAILPGLVLRISPGGTKAWNALYYSGGKPRYHKLGRYPIINLVQARERARAFLADPQAALATAEKVPEMSFGAAAALFIERYATPKLKPRTIEEYRRTLEGGRLKTWQNRPIGKIARRDVLAVIDALEAERKLPMARLVLANLSKFFAWAAERDLVADDPTARVRAAGAAKPRERALSIDELRMVWKAAGKVGGIGGAFVKVLALTGQRRHETSVMRWRDLSGLDGDEPVWALPAASTKNGRPHSVPLAVEVVAILKALPHLAVPTDSDLAPSDLVFTSTGATPISGFSKIKLQIDRELEKIISEENRGKTDEEKVKMEPWTFHDLRRSLVTGMNDAGMAPPHIIEATVNHVSGFRGGVAGTYNRALYMAERRQALTAWARLILVPASPANVLPMRKPPTTAA